MRGAANVGADCRMTLILTVTNFRTVVQISDRLLTHPETGEPIEDSAHKMA